MGLPATLLQGYKNFVDGHLDENQDKYQDLADNGQSPHTMIISCCDSRALPETIFSAGPGELFVIRNVANLVPAYDPQNGPVSTPAAVEFAVNALKVKNIIVMGHAKCGGIAASLATDMQPLSDANFVGRWINDIKHIAHSSSELEGLSPDARQTAMEQLSIRNSIENLRSIPFVAQLESDEKLSLIGAWFDIASGKLWLMDRQTGAFAPV